MPLKLVAYDLTGTDGDFSALDQEMLAFPLCLHRLRDVVDLSLFPKLSRVFGNGVHIGLWRFDSHETFLDHLLRQRLLMLAKILLARFLGPGVAGRNVLDDG